MNKDFDEMVAELVNIETNESCHDDYEENYDTTVEFYLSNVIIDSYIPYVMESMGVDEDTAIKLQKEVIFKIKLHFS